MTKIDVSTLDVGEDVPARDGYAVVSWAEVQKLKERADELVDHSWDEYLADLRSARAASADGAVPVQHALAREVVLARIAALTARFSLPIKTGHRKYDGMSDGDLRSLLADIEELIAGEA